MRFHQLLNPIRRAFVRRGIAVHCIGDSHSSFFSGQDEMQDEWPKKPKDRWPCLRSYRLGPALAYNLIRHGTTSRGREKLLSAIGSIPKGERILLCYGEIDCRAHLLKQAKSQNVAAEILAEQCAGRYMEAVLDVRQRGYQVMAWNVVPPTVLNGEDWYFPVIGTFEERMAVTRAFNRSLSQQCAASGVPYISIFDRLLDYNGIPDRRYFADQIHLSSAAIPLAIDALRPVCPEIHFPDSQSFASGRSAA